MVLLGVMEGTRLVVVLARLASDRHVFFKLHILS